jgi:catechol-2,3-dioxygenase
MADQVVGRITGMGYVALRTRDLAASTRNATDILGLHSVENTGTKAYLSAAATHHELVYTQSDTDGADHFGVVAGDPAELAAIREKVRRDGYRVLSEQPIEEHIEAGFAFVGPAGFTWHVYLGMNIFDNRTGGFGPDRYGHINLRVPNSVEMRDFLIDIFDFRVSDQVGIDGAFFMRCNPEHHGIAVFKDAALGPVLHHHAWQTQTIADLGRLGDRLARAGRRLMWGPVRHGAGHNIAAYHLEPCGDVIELYTDMEFVYDRERKVVVWDEEDSYWISQWDGLVPADLLRHGVGPARR